MKKEFDIKTLPKAKDKFVVSVKVGPKGQITIPKEARDMFSIKEGESLLVLGDKKRGIAIVRSDFLYELMEREQNDGNSD